MSTIIRADTVEIGTRDRMLLVIARFSTPENEENGRTSLSLFLILETEISQFDFFFFFDLVEFRILMVVDSGVWEIGYLRI